ncbi:MAG: hypothetical protein ACPLXS_00665 [Candidatus Micrarchaeales archaeon]
MDRVKNQKSELKDKLRNELEDLNTKVEKEIKKEILEEIKGSFIRKVNKSEDQINDDKSRLNGKLLLEQLAEKTGYKFIEVKNNDKNHKEDIYLIHAFKIIFATKYGEVLASLIQTLVIHELMHILENEIFDYGKNEEKFNRFFSEGLAIATEIRAIEVIINNYKNEEVLKRIYPSLLYNARRLEHKKFDYSEATAYIYFNYPFSPEEVKKFLLFSYKLFDTDSKDFDVLRFSFFQNEKIIRLKEKIDEEIWGPPK